MIHSSATNEESSPSFDEISDCIVDMQPKDDEIIDISETEEIEEEVEEKKEGSKKVRVTLIVLGSLTGLIGLTFLLAFLLQRSLLYHPYTSEMVNPFDYGSFGEEIISDSLSRTTTKGWQTVEITTEDGEKLHSYMIFANKTIADTPKNPFTILLLHGNAGNIGNRLYYPTQLRNCNVLLLGYRGFGKSTGSPSEIGLKTDAQAALDWLHANLDEEGRKRIVVYGQSLGGAVAIHLASENPDKVKGLIVENTFLSVPKLVSDWNFITRSLSVVVDQVFDSASAIKKVKAPILFLSGRKDTLIPPAHMDKLFELATSAESKEFVSLPYVRIWDAFNSDGKEVLGKAGDIWFCGRIFLYGQYSNGKYQKCIGDLKLPYNFDSLVSEMATYDFKSESDFKKSIEYIGEQVCTRMNSTKEHTYYPYTCDLKGGSYEASSLNSNVYVFISAMIGLVVFVVSFGIYRKYKSQPKEHVINNEEYPPMGPNSSSNSYQTSSTSQYPQSVPLANPYAVNPNSFISSPPRYFATNPPTYYRR